MCCVDVLRNARSFWFIGHFIFLMEHRRLMEFVPLSVRGKSVQWVETLLQDSWGTQQQKQLWGGSMFTVTVDIWTDMIMYGFHSFMIVMLERPVFALSPKKMETMTVWTNKLTEFQLNKMLISDSLTATFLVPKSSLR